VIEKALDLLLTGLKLVVHFHDVFLFSIALDFNQGAPQAQDTSGSNQLFRG